MNYIFITPYFPSVASIIGPFVYDQVQAVKRAGVFDRVIVLKPCAWYHRSLEYTHDHVTVYLFRSFELPSKIFPDLFNTLNRFFFYRRLKQLGLSLSDQSIVHLHTAPLAKYGVWFKRKSEHNYTCLQHHDLDPMLVRMGVLRKWSWHQRLVLKRRVYYTSQIDLQICVSDLALKQLQVFPKNTHTSFRDYDEKLQYFSDLPSVNIQNAYVLRNGVDLAKFGGKKIEKNTNMLSPEKLTIGCVGAFNEWKGQQTLIHAVALLFSDKINLQNEKEAHEIQKEQRIKDKPLEVIFIGVGPERKRCEALVRQYGLQHVIHFENVRAHRELGNFYQSLDLFVLPSTFETFACVYLEAYACGVPFICCAGQGNAESIPVEDYAKWIVEPDNVDQLAERIEAFYINRYSQRLTHEYNIDVLVGEFLDSAIKITSSRGAHCGSSHKKTS